MRIRGRVDTNQSEIVKAARKMGASVAILSNLGNGIPDILIGHKGKNLLVEIKDGTKPPSKRKLTPDELEFHNNWRGQICIIESIDDLIKLLVEV